MRTLLIARKSLIEILREPQLVGIVIIMPVIFVAISAMAYGQPLAVTHPIHIYNDDPALEPLVQTLADQRYAAGGAVFKINRTDSPTAAEEKLQDRETAAVLTLNTSADGDMDVTVRGDVLNMAFNRADAMFKSLIRRYADADAGRMPVIAVETEPLTRDGPETFFDLYAPGMFVFAWLLLIPQVALLVAREVRWHTLNRLRLTPMRAWDLLAGTALAQLAVGLVQVVCVFAAALLMGFNNQGSLVAAVVIGLAICFSAIGVGLVVACFVQDDSQATNLGGAVAMIEVFASGSFYALTPITLFTLAGHQVDLFDFLPASHGFLALQQVLCYGASLSDVSFRLGMTFVTSALYLIGGVLIFQRLKMRDHV
jgi:ABC-2 type transport system permease protein